MSRILPALLGALCSLPMSAGAETSLADDALHAFELIQSWRVEDARPVVTRLLERAPEHPLVRGVSGQLRFHLGDYEGAVRDFEAARAGGVPPELLVDAEAAEKARVTTAGYLEVPGEHFVIRHPPGKDAMLVPFAAEALEAARARIGGLLGWLPEERVVLELYPTAKTLAAVSSLTPEDIETSGTIALCRWNRLMATTPRAVVFGYAWRDTLAHELAHLIIGGASRNTVPIWLHEGLAKFVETSWRGEPGMGVSVEQQRALKKAAKKGELIAFEAMHPSMAKLPSQEAASLAFTEVFTFIEFLVARKGWPGIQALLRTMAAGKSDTAALAEVYGDSLEGLEKAWKKTLSKRPIRRPADGRAVKGDRALVLKSTADGPEDDLDGLDPVARRHARAADLLFTRNRLLAAQRELEKAFEISRSPLVSAKLATLALANDDLARAEEAARSSIEARPELAGPNVTLAEILLRRGDQAAMKLPLERAIDVNPFDPRIHQLTLAAEPKDSEAARRARVALAWSNGQARMPDNDPGHGATVVVQGLPFSRVYLTRGEQRFAPGVVTPTAPLELTPGTWRVVLLPPRGPSQERALELSKGDERVIRFDP